MLLTMLTQQGGCHPRVVSRIVRDTVAAGDLTAVLDRLFGIYPDEVFKFTIGGGGGVEYSVDHNVVAALEDLASGDMREQSSSALDKKSSKIGGGAGGGAGKGSGGGKSVKLFSTARNVTKFQLQNQLQRGLDPSLMVVAVFAMRRAPLLSALTLLAYYMVASAAKAWYIIKFHDRTIAVLMLQAEDSFDRGFMNQLTDLVIRRRWVNGVFLTLIMWISMSTHEDVWHNLLTTWYPPSVAVANGGHAGIMVHARFSALMLLAIIINAFKFMTVTVPAGQRFMNFKTWWSFVSIYLLASHGAHVVRNQA